MAKRNNKCRIFIDFGYKDKKILRIMNYELRIILIFAKSL